MKMNSNSFYAGTVMVSMIKTEQGKCGVRVSGIAANE
jgi:hypothetical protein